MGDHAARRGQDARRHRGGPAARAAHRRVLARTPRSRDSGPAPGTATTGPRAGTRRDLRTGFTSLTYQSLAVFDEDAEEPTGRGRTSDRLHPNGLALIETLEAAGPLTIVLDECHHLLEVWGELLARGARPAAGRRRARADRDTARLDDPCAGRPDPHAVRRRSSTRRGSRRWSRSAPSRRTPSSRGSSHRRADEAAWLDEQSVRFNELTSDLFDPAFGSTPCPQWLTQRFVQPVEDDGSTWPELAGREPELTDAALRLVHADLMSLPAGAILHEQHRQPPTAQDWVALLEDWLLRCVQPRSLVEGEEGERDRAVIEAVRRTLPAIGYVWTKRGIRTGRGNVDRVTARSAAKQGAVAGIVSAELSNLGDDARILVLCDHERATATTRRRLTDGQTPPPQPAGSATGVLAGLLADPDTATLDPMLITGSTVAGAEETLWRLVDAIDRTHPGLAASLTVDKDGEVPTLTGRWTTGQWVEHVTRFFAEGGTRAVVGTRGLLGEGWDAQSITTVIDLTTATTPTAVVQTRGRALRVDPARPEKVALIWTVVCVFEGHVAGANDWERFSRKHRGYFTIDEHGTLADGVAGVDSTFSDYHPPPVAGFDAINARMVVRSEDRATLREGWLAETSYADRVEHIVRVRPGSARTEPVPDTVGTTGAAGLVPWTVQSRRRPALDGGTSRPRGGRAARGRGPRAAGGVGAADRPPRPARRLPLRAQPCARRQRAPRDPRPRRRRRSPTASAGPGCPRWTTRRCTSRPTPTALPRSAWWPRTSRSPRSSPRPSRRSSPRCRGRATWSRGGSPRRRTATTGWLAVCGPSPAGSRTERSGTRSRRCSP